MTDEGEALLRYRLERAGETLREARGLVPLELWHGCVNRLYYACFYAATALLESRGFRSTKHSGVLSLFNQHFVHGGIVPKEVAAVYNMLFDKRLQADYADLLYLERTDVEHLIPQVESFVLHVRGVLGIPQLNE